MILLSDWAKSRGHPDGPRRGNEQAADRLDASQCQRWRGSCHLTGWYPVFRSLVFSIVLTLVIGADVPLLCMALCDPAVAAASGCHNRENPSDVSARLRDGRDCDVNPLLGTPYVKEEGRRAAPSPPTDFALGTVDDSSNMAMNTARCECRPVEFRSLDKRPVGIALRI